MKHFAITLVQIFCVITLVQACGSSGSKSSGTEAPTTPTQQAQSIVGNWYTDCTKVETGSYLATLAISGSTIFTTLKIYTDTACSTLLSIETETDKYTVNGNELDFTPESDNLQRGYTPGQTYYNIFLIENSILYFGDASANVNTRPTAVNVSEAFKKGA